MLWLPIYLVATIDSLIVIEHIVVVYKNVARFVYMQMVAWEIRVSRR